MSLTKVEGILTSNVCSSALLDYDLLLNAAVSMTNLIFLTMITFYHEVQHAPLDMQALR
jgi:hypothetical protein